MKKSLTREIHDGENCTDIVVKCGLFIGGAFLVAVLLIVGWTMMNQVREADVASERYQKELTQREADPAWQKEKLRLRRQHGDHVIIYEPGKIPYYRCGQYGKDKCKYF